MEKPLANSAARITIAARLAEVARLGQWVDQWVEQWLDAQAAARSLAAETAFAVRLCLEESAANIILHGHGGDCAAEITASLSAGADGAVELTIEDQARPFNPATAELPPALDIAERVGGQGLRLIREFASRVTHEALPTGNRVTLTFLPGKK